MAWGNYNYYNKYQQEQIQESQYNSAAQKIFRMHESWLKCRQLWREGNLESLNFELDYVWIELEADSLKKQRKFIRKLNSKIETAMSMQKHQKNPKSYVLIRNALAKLLKKKWMFLFRVEKFQGLGKKYKEEGEGDLF